MSVVPVDELVWRFGPSGGPGGQHANTANTRAEVVLEIEDSPYSQDNVDSSDDARKPQIIFYASGEVTEGAIDIHGVEDELLWRIEWDLLGRFEVMPRGIADEDEED